MPETPQFKLPENYPEILSTAATLAHIMRAKIKAVIGPIDSIYRCEAAQPGLMLSYNDGFEALSVLKGSVPQLHVKFNDKAGNCFINRLKNEDLVKFLQAQIKAVSAL